MPYDKQSLTLAQKCNECFMHKQNANLIALLTTDLFISSFHPVINKKGEIKNNILVFISEYISAELVKSTVHVKATVQSKLKMKAHL